jgi:flagellar basal body P-ring protein FlgI
MSNFISIEVQVPTKQRKVLLKGLQSIPQFKERVRMSPKLQVIIILSHQVNNIYKKFNELGMKSKMIIQVHDEIVCEVPNEEVDILFF